MFTHSATQAAPLQAPSSRRLATGIAISLLLHGLLLSLQFGIPGLRPGAGNPLRVVLAPMPKPPLAELLPVPAPTPVPPVSSLPDVAPAVPPAPVVAPPVPAPAPVPRRGFALLDPVPAMPPPPAPKPAPRRLVRRRSRPRPAEPREGMDTPVIAREAKDDNGFKLPEAAPEAPEQLAMKDDPALEKEQVPDARELAEERERFAAERERQREARLAAEEEALKAQLDAEARKRAEQERTQLAEQSARFVEDMAKRQREDQERERAAQRLAEQQRADELARQQAAEQQRAQQVAEQRRAEELARQQFAEQQRAQQLAEQRRAEELARQQLAEQQRAQQLAEQRRAEELARQQLAEQQRAQQLAQQRQAEQQAREAALQQQAEQARQQAQEAARRLALQQPAAPARSEPGAGSSGNASGRADPFAGTGARDEGGRGSGALPRGDFASRARELLRGIDIDKPVPQAMRPAEQARQAIRRALAEVARREVPLRMYLDSVRQKVERNAIVAETQLASAAMRGEPVVSVSIRSDGSVEDVAIVRSSGRPDVDEVVRRIVRLNARYSAFPANVAAHYDVIELRRVWSFVGVLRLMEEVP